MSIPVLLRQGELGTTGQCFFSRPGAFYYKRTAVDNHLQTLSDVIDSVLRIPKPESILIHYDDLCLEFDGTEGILINIDGRTNFDNEQICKHVNMDIPKPSHSGALALQTPWPDSHTSGGIVIEQFFDESTRTLMLRLDDATECNYWQVGTDIIAGVHESRLVVIYLCNMIEVYPDIESRHATNPGCLWGRCMKRR